MRRIAIPILLLIMSILAGCEGDPETSRLAPGDEVIGRGAGDSVLVYSKPDGKGDWLSVPVGVKMRVVDDGEEAKVPSVRSVRVAVVEGEHAGHAGYATRADLHPIPR